MPTAVNPELAAKKAEDTPEAAAIKAIIPLSELKHMLKIVAAAVKGTSTIPVLQCVRMEQIESGFALEATDLDVYIRAILQKHPGPKTPVLIPAQKFAAWTKLLSGDDVKISATDRRATMQCGRARATLPVWAADHWPRNDVYKMKADGITLTQGDFARALRFALIAMSTEESRSTLNGILLQGDGEQLRLVATDGHRLMIYALPCTEKITLLLPGQFIRALLPLLTDEDGGIDLFSDDNMILCRIDGDMRISVGAPKLTGQFPNYEAVIPKTNTAEITANSADLLASLERSALLSDERSGLVTLAFDKQITLTAASAANGESEETVDCIGSPQEALKIGVYAQYLIDLMKRLDGDVRIALPESNHMPLLLTAAPHEGETLSYIVMPMRLD